MERKKRSKKTALVLLAVTLLVICLGYWVYRRTFATPAGRERVQVRRGTLTAIVEAMGEVQPAHEVWLSLKVSGTIARIYVNMGDVVSKGDTLLELETTALQRQVREAELNLEIRQLQLAKLKAGPSEEDIAIAKANLAAAQNRLEQLRKRPTQDELIAAKAALDKAEMALHLAQAEYDRISWMPEVGMMPQAIALQQATADYEIARTNYETVKQGATTEELSIAESEAAAARAQLTKVLKGASEEDIAIMEKQVLLAELALQEAQQRLAEARLIAPFSGTVLSLEAKEGENVYANSQLLHLADLHTLKIAAQIDELDVGSVAIGQAVAIRLDAFPGQTLPGKVQSLAPGATTHRGSTTYEAIIAFDPGNLPVRPGMAANLTITTAKRENVLLIPNRAIQTLGRRKVVKRLEGRTVRQIEVTTGLSNLEETEIISGLNEGDVLIID